MRPQTALPLIPLLLLAASARGLAQAPPGKGVRRALLIGINEFAAPSIVSLRGALNDIETMRKLLTTRYGFAEDAVKMLTNAQATRKGILDALDGLVKEAGAEDVVYFHFSGHGSQVKDLNGDEGQDDGLDETILPQDARTEGIADITDDELAQYLSSLKARSVIVTLDSCHSGTGTRGDSAVRARVAAPDTRLSLYETPANLTSSRGLVPIEEAHVLMTGAAAHQAALDGPVDGKVYGFFSYSLAKSLAAAREDAKPEDIFAGVRSELRRIQEQLGRSSMPTPQLEMRKERAGARLFPPAGSGEARGVPRRPFVTVKPLTASTALLVDGALLHGVPSSLWAIFRPGETSFLPARVIATGVVTETRGRDAVLRLASRMKQMKSIPPGARAVAIASPAADTVPLRLGRIPPAARERLQNLLGQRLQGVAEVVGEERFARFILDHLPEGASRWSVSDSTGVNAVRLFEDQAVEALAGKLERFLVRSRNATELLALDNAISGLELAVEVHRGSTPGGGAAVPGLASSEFGQDRRGIRVVADTTAPRYRIRKPGEPRTAENSLQLEVRASADCYLTIVDIDSEGGINVLFPNATQGEDFYPEGRIRGGETVLIPDSLASGNRARFFLDYGPPSGLDTIRAFASVSPETTRTIREFAGRTTGEVGTRSLAKSLREMQILLARPRGVVVIADAAGDAGGSDASSAEPNAGASAAAGAEDLAAEEPGAQDPGALEGDWTAKSLTILVED
jgi:hypothetical protein